MAIRLSTNLESAIARRARALGLTPEKFLLSLIERGVSESELDSIGDTRERRLPDGPTEVAQFFGLWRRHGHAVDVERYLNQMRDEWR